MSALNSRRVQNPVTPMRPIPGNHNVPQECIAMTPSSPWGNHSVPDVTAFDRISTSPAGSPVPSTSSKKSKASGMLGIVEGVARGRRAYRLYSFKLMTVLLISLFVQPSPALDPFPIFLMASAQANISMFK